MSTLSAARKLTAPKLQEVVKAVVQRAKEQGFLRPSEIREELLRAGESATLWKDVVALARASLSSQRGRYYYASPVSQRLLQAKSQQEGIARAAGKLIDYYRAAASEGERRGEERIDFIQPIQLQTEDGRKFTLLSRDLSTCGMRLIGTRSLLGQKVRVRILPTSECDGYCFVLRILWTCAIGDDLFENGGTFVEAIEESGD
jgi:hypothetical protein